MNAQQFSPSPTNNNHSSYSKHRIEAEKAAFKMRAKSINKKRELAIKNEREFTEKKMIWNEQILPNWNEYSKENKKVRDLCNRGIPATLRGKVWSLLIGNELKITEVNFSELLEYSSLIHERILEIKREEDESNLIYDDTTQESDLSSLPICHEPTTVINTTPFAIKISPRLPSHHTSPQLPLISVTNTDGGKIESTYLLNPDPLFDVDYNGLPGMNSDSIYDHELGIRIPVNNNASPPKKVEPLPTSLNLTPAGLEGDEAQPNGDDEDVDEDEDDYDEDGIGPIESPLSVRSPQSPRSPSITTDKILTEPDHFVDSHDLKPHEDTPYSKANRSSLANYFSRSSFQTSPSTNSERKLAKSFSNDDINQPYLIYAAPAHRNTTSIHRSVSTNSPRVLERYPSIGSSGSSHQQRILSSSELKHVPGVTFDKTTSLNRTPSPNSIPNHDRRKKYKSFSEHLLFSHRSASIKKSFGLEIQEESVASSPSGGLRSPDITEEDWFQNERNASLDESTFQEIVKTVSGGGGNSASRLNSHSGGSGKGRDSSHIGEIIRVTGNMEVTGGDYEEDLERMVTKDGRSPMKTISALTALLKQSTEGEGKDLIPLQDRTEESIGINPSIQSEENHLVTEAWTHETIHSINNLIIKSNALVRSKPNPTPQVNSTTQTPSKPVTSPEIPNLPFSALSSRHGHGTNNSSSSSGVNKVTANGWSSSNKECGSIHQENHDQLGYGSINSISSSSLNKDPPHHTPHSHGESRSKSGEIFLTIEKALHHITPTSLLTGYPSNTPSNVMDPHSIRNNLFTLSTLQSTSSSHEKTEAYESVDMTTSPSDTTHHLHDSSASNPSSSYQPGGFLLKAASYTSRLLGNIVITDDNYFRRFSSSRMKEQIPYQIKEEIPSKKVTQDIPILYEKPKKKDVQQPTNSNPLEGLSSYIVTSLRTVINGMEVDLPRTFPTIAYFHDGGAMHTELERILLCYACFRPDIGYVQGMSFIVAMLLLNMNEFQAFKCLANLLARRIHSEFFQLKIGEFVHCFNHYFKKFLPLLYKHMRNERVRSEMFLLDWILSIYTKALPLDVAAFIWDSYLCEGEIFLLTAGLGILKMYAKRLSTLCLEEITAFLLHLPENIRSDELFGNISQITVSKSGYEKARKRASELNKSSNIFESG